jgi:glucan biosynthesis protein C
MNPPAARAPRDLHLDNLKVALTALVVVHHAAQPYGPPEDWPVRSGTAGLPLGPFFEVNGAFFMGLFFLVSALFLPRAVDAGGPFGMLRARLLRLGAPLLLMVLLVFGPASYLMRSPPTDFWTYYVLRYIRRADVEVGHLWFLSFLLLMSAAYALWRLVRPAAPSRAVAPPRHAGLVAAVIVLMAANAAIRTRFPVGLWVDLAPFLRLEVGRAPQYVLLFIGGLTAGRFGWLSAMPASRGFIWLSLGLAAATLRLCQPALVPLPPWAWLVEEAVIGVGLGVGLPILARERLNRSIPGLTRAAPDAFGVYLVHVPLIVALQLAAETLPFGAWGRLAFVVAAGLAASLALARLLRRTPGLRRIL